MTALAARLKALSKRVALLKHDVEQGKEVSPFTLAALMQLEAALDELDKTLPPARRGRPKKSESATQSLTGLVAVLKTYEWLGIKTDKDALQWIFRPRKGQGRARVILKTQRNRLAQAHKAPK